MPSRERGRCLPEEQGQLSILLSRFDPGKLRVRVCLAPEIPSSVAPGTLSLSPCFQPSCTPPQPLPKAEKDAGAPRSPSRGG